MKLSEDVRKVAEQEAKWPTDEHLPSVDYYEWADQIAALEAHNRQLLNDADASPAIIAGYRDNNARLQDGYDDAVAQNGELKVRVKELEAHLEVCREALAECEVELADAVRASQKATH